MLNIDPICLIDEGSVVIFSGKQRRTPGPALSIRRTVMLVRSSLSAALIAAALGAAHADGVRPIEAVSLDLGEVSGVAYYTVERDGLRVVATLAPGEAGPPVRMVAVLAPGQSVVLSTSQQAGTVEISRRADAVLVRKTAATN
jgi:hypothetical protein